MTSPPPTLAGAMTLSWFAALEKLGNTVGLSVGAIDGELVGFAVGIAVGLPVEAIDGG